MFLGGTRLTRFMDSVEKAAASVPPPAPAEPESAETETRTAATEAPPQPTPHPRGPAEGAAVPERIWEDIVTAGVSLLEKLGQALAAAGTVPPDDAGSHSLPSTLIAQDARTGQPCLQIPLPDPETLQRISGVLAALAKNR